MTHNPEKNKALCYIARGIDWTLPKLFAALLVSILTTVLGLAVYHICLGLYDLGLVNGLKAFGGLLLVMLIIGLPITVLAFIAEWAEKYKKDC